MGVPPYKGCDKNHTYVRGCDEAHPHANYYHCTKEILAGLGQMYVADERFQNNIDKHGNGTAAFIRDAIQVYCGK